MEHGGMQFPDIVKYYTAVHISMIVRFLQDEDANFWSTLYKEVAYPYALKGIICKKKMKDREAKSNPFLNTCIQIWNKWKPNLLPPTRGD